MKTLPVAVRQRRDSALLERVAIGRRVQEYREYLGLTREQVSDRTGLHRNIVARFESSKTIPRLDTFLLICKALRRPAEYFLPKDAPTKKLAP